MRYLPKIARLFLIFVASALILLVMTALFMQDKVTNLVITSLNKNLPVKLEAGSVRFSFIRKFPRASVQLRDVVVLSTSSLISASYGRSADTLLEAGSVFLIFRPLDLLKGNFTVESTSVRRGTIRLLADSKGNVNYRISEGGDNFSGSGTAFSIDLQRIELNDIFVVYSDLSDSLRIFSQIRNASLRSMISGNNIDLYSKAEMKIDSLSVSGIEIFHPFQAVLDLSLQKSSEGLSFGKSFLKIDDFNFTVEGKISADDVADLMISGDKLDISGILQYLPDRYSSRASEYRPSGILTAGCLIKGSLKKGDEPHVEINCSLENGGIDYVGKGLHISGITFSGRLSDGPGKNDAGSLEVKDLSFKLGTSEYKGSVRISDLKKPKTDIAISGRLFPAEIRDFFGFKALTTASGAVDIDLRLSTEFRPGDSLIFADLRPEGRLNFSSLSIGYKNRFLVNDVNGRIDLSETIKSSGLLFKYRGQKIRIDGEFVNLPDWLAGRPVMLIANGSLRIDRLNPETIFPSSESDKPGGTGSSFPDDIIASIRLVADSLMYKSFRSSGVSASLTYKPRMLTFKELKMNTLKGAVSGEGFIVQNNNGSIISKGDLVINGIDVNNAFTSFGNFGQDFIVAENLSGRLSGTISFLLPMDREFRTKVNAITADGNFSLENGALIDFEPVKQLSNFIELSELENINFQKMENDFFIRNNTLYLPKMDVRSSAADLTINGQHSFENSYEYHIKMLLSQLLSKKRKSARKPVTEFGAVQDDGLGRTSILLKIESKGDDVKVGYDLKAVGREVKNNIRNEKQSLKTILNEEYGWYKNDQPAATTPPKKKSRFSITFEETDTIIPETDDKKPSGKSLFRRR